MHTVSVYCVVSAEEKMELLVVCAVLSESVCLCVDVFQCYGWGGGGCSLLSGVQQSDGLR